MRYRLFLGESIVPVSSNPPLRGPVSSYLFPTKRDSATKSGTFLKGKAKDRIREVLTTTMRRYHDKALHTSSSLLVSVELNSWTRYRCRNPTCPFDSFIEVVFHRNVRNSLFVWDPPVFDFYF